MQEKNGQRDTPRAVVWGCYALVGGGLLLLLWLLFTYGLDIVAPFLLGWLLSRPIRPLVRRMVGRSRMPRGLAAGALVCLFVVAVGGLAAWGISRGLSEAGRLLEGLAQDSDGGFLTDIQDFFDSVTSHIPFLRGLSEHPVLHELCERVDGMVREGATQVLSSLGRHVPAALLSAVSSLPSVLLFVTSLLFSCYYFSADDGRLWQGFLFCLPEGWRERAEGWRGSLGMAAKKYVRAYLLLGGITFVEMFLGLTVLGVPYAFLIAWGIALIDFLPLLGTGAVLIPWAVVTLVMGDMRLGLGLLILFGVSSLLRQFTEPRLLGAELGLHPLASLLAVYAGWKLFGVWGMMLAPFGALWIKALVQKKREE